jgi:hypothetical protein
MEALLGLMVGILWVGSLTIALFLGIVLVCRVRDYYREHYR